MVLSCSSVRASVCASRNIVNTISCKVFDTFSPNLAYINDVLWDRNERINLGSQGQRSRSRQIKVCWKQHFLDLLCTMS